MNLIAKLVTSLVIAAIAATAYNYLALGAAPGAMLLLAFALATVVTALTVSIGGSSAPSSKPAAKKRPPAKAAASKGTASPEASSPGREHGQVKWFNVSKGFGFITKDDGEEIFVHFRSIRGSGRRGLRDGQNVSFVVAQSDKGPQAEDVEGLE